VPALPAGHAAAGLGRFKVHFDDTWAFGTYAIRICADAHHRVDERYETNNCKKLHRMYVVPGLFEGTVKGIGPLANDLFPGVTLSWTTEKLLIGEAFHRDRAADGLFDYYPVRGSVIYKLAGTDSGGCTWSGSGTYNPQTWPAPLHLAYGRVPHYSARDIVKTDWAFTANVACPGHGTSHPSISPSLWGFTRWFDTGPNARPLRDPGLVRLRGRNTDQRAHGTTTINWNLEVQA
jgi:hypothetical protein